MSQIDDEWQRVLATLDQDPARTFNLAHECCFRWSGEPGRVALSIHEPDGSSQRHTYRDLAVQAERAANAFVAAGLTRGDRIAALLTRQIETWIAAIGAWRAGLVYVPLFCGFGPEAIAQRLNAAEVSAVVVDGRWRHVLEKAQSANDIQVFTVGDDVRPEDLDFRAELAAPHPKRRSSRHQPESAPRYRTADQSSAISAHFSVL
jgi:acetyl-CoA synthetase